MELNKMNHHSRNNACLALNKEEFLDQWTGPSNCQTHLPASQDDTSPKTAHHPNSRFCDPEKGTVETLGDLKWSCMLLGDLEWLKVAVSEPR